MRNKEEDECIVHAEEADIDTTPTKPEKKPGTGVIVIAPLVIAFGFFMYLISENAFCSSMLTVILAYGLLAAVYAARGGTIPQLEPELPKDIDIPEEYEGRPKLYLAYLVEQAAEKDTLARMVAARGPGMDPASKYNKWDRL